MLQFLIHTLRPSAGQQGEKFLFINHQCNSLPVSFQDSNTMAKYLEEV